MKKVLFQDSYLFSYLNTINFSESYKFIRMADDLHDVASYLNDMRICFIALTVTGKILNYFKICLEN